MGVHFRIKCANYAELEKSGHKMFTLFSIVLHFLPIVLIYSPNPSAKLVF